MTTNGRVVAARAIGGHGRREARDICSSASVDALDVSAIQWRCGAAKDGCAACVPPFLVRSQSCERGTLWLGWATYGIVLGFTSMPCMVIPIRWVDFTVTPSNYFTRTAGHCPTLPSVHLTVSDTNLNNDFDGKGTTLWAQPTCAAVGGGAPPR